MWPRDTTLRHRLSPEPWVIGALVVWTLVPLMVLATGRGVFNGGFGLHVSDQMMYMGFIRESGQHFLVANPFDVVPDPHLYLDPVFALSGLVWRLGGSIQLALLLWVPIGLVALATGFTAYVRRMLAPDRAAVTIGLLLAFFYVAPAMPLADWMHLDPTLRGFTRVVGLEMFAGGYASTERAAIVAALMPVTLLAVERLLDLSHRAPGRSAGWYAVWAGLAGMFAAWIHPWQGMTLLVIFAALAVWGRFDRRDRLLAVPMALTAAPLCYFLALSYTHSSWMMEARPSGLPHFGWWLVLGLLPAALALPGFPGRDLDVQERLVRIWPVAAGAVYLALDRTGFYRVFVGLSLPLAILAVRGWSRLRSPRLIVPAVILAVTVPGMIWYVQQLTATRGEQFFSPGEARALAFLDRSPRKGPVLAPADPFGQAVPAFSGRQTYIGTYWWTPDYFRRQALADAMFDGRLPRMQAIHLVRASQAVLLASDCQRSRINLQLVLGDLVERVWRFGCATVYELRPA